MKSATILTPPSTGLSGILLSVRTQYGFSHIKEGDDETEGKPIRF